MPQFYIHRKLHRSDTLVEDNELIGRTGVFVVLAEPGAGKTELLDFFSRSYGVAREAASLFVHRSPTQQTVLIVDALDEVARIGEERINEIIVKARATSAGTIIFASRSYVWDQARSATVRDCFGSEPTVLRLEPFDDDEQHALFTNYLPSESFQVFKAEVARFELSPLLGNPQFLKLFADAYIEGGRRFTSKKQIYTDAVRRLASERRTVATATQRPEIRAIIAAASEIFSKLLLSGATGVSVSEEIDGNDYPYSRVVSSDAHLAAYALDTRLFKPTDFVNQHDPVHRIVAEYCAADHLVGCIEAPTNTLSLKRCLAVIAPNSTVRDELRGLLGWMASLGSRDMQETIVKLDPYAVFANGDASQLHPSIKHLLLDGLRTLAEDDPFFRRMDAWRRFNVAGFFTADMVAHVRPLLSPKHSDTHLRGLMLELLYDTEAGKGLESEFRQILRDTGAEETERQQAYQNLAVISKPGLGGDFDALVKEASRDSLDIASTMLKENGIHYFGQTRTSRLLDALSRLYRTVKNPGYRDGSRYFIRRLISTFGLNDTQHFLDAISRNIRCTCGQANQHRCTCRRGNSKIAGYLLDRYFETMVGPHDPRQIKRWTEPLHFRGRVHADQSFSVGALTRDTGLRRAVQLLMLDGLTELEEIGDRMVNFFMSSTHSGLSFWDGDYEALVDHAMATNNYALWQHLIVTHSPYDSRKGPYPLRAKMRSQARSSLHLLQVWSKVNRDHRIRQQRDFVRFGRSNKRLRRENAERKAALLSNFEENRQLIETGRHWGWLRALAQRFLFGAHEDDLVIEDQVIESALLNCFDFLASVIPSLETLAERGRTDIQMALEAACLMTFRKTGRLDNISHDILRAVKAGTIGGSAYREGEAGQLEDHIDSLIFLSDADRIEFARRLIEPHVNRTGDAPTNVPLLNHRHTFDSVKGALAIDWLTRYPAMPWYALETLFGIAATHADRFDLHALIEARCNDPIDRSESGAQRRTFWLLRHFFFILPTSDEKWTELSACSKAIFEIERYAGRFERHDAKGWPQLNARQVFRVLDAFVVAWPKVPLPSSWGTGDPEEETAYRFLTDVIFLIGRDNPSNAIPIFDLILAGQKFEGFYNAIKSQRADAVRKQALSGFRPPAPEAVAKLLDNNKIASVEDMRALLVELLDELQHRLKGAATNPVNVFYAGDRRVNENTARDRVVEMLDARLRALNLGVVVEHQMVDSTRCDITASTVIDGIPVVLVTEVKGQWNPQLFTAASVQLARRYTIYPGAADQGVYLILWFGDDVTVAGRKMPSLNTPALLRSETIGKMPAELKGRIDVYVLDVSRTKAANSKRKKVAKKIPPLKSFATRPARSRKKAGPKRLEQPSQNDAPKFLAKRHTKGAAKSGAGKLRATSPRTKKIKTKRTKKSHG
ncbi:NACHT domain-containing protein [Bradyrhizobium sp. 930_D9_N1_4]|uniref:NACHT domain-containing protein n=1 Tax=Bradyrhizobium sp. 930_D9_N1_4 TaxID=3240374 RepID=UPI003F88B739